MKAKLRFRTTIIPLVAISVLASCKVSRDVALPEIKLPSAYRNSSRVTDTISIASVKWQDFFSDPELQKLLGRALQKNNDMLIAVQNIEASRQALIQAGFGNIPSIGIQAIGSISRPSDNSFSGLNIKQALNATHVQDYSLGVYLSWEADIWGKIRSQKESALASYLQSQEAKKAVQTQLVSQIAKGYFNLQMLDALLEIARQNLLLNDSTLRIINLQFSAGQVSSLAVQQAEAQRLVSAALIPQFEQSIGIQENALSILTGELPNVIERDNNFKDLQIPDSLSAGVPVALLSYRPDVRQFEFALAKANADVGYTKAQMYPSFSITAITGLDAFKASNWFNIPASIFGSAAGNLAQPLFNQRRLRTQYEIAKTLRESSVFRFRQSLLLAVGEVSDAILKMEKLKSQQSFEAQRAQTLRRATQNSNLLFKNGLASYLEVIIAQSNVLQSELQLAGIKKARLDAVVDLYRAVGGGWK